MTCLALWGQVKELATDSARSVVMLAAPDLVIYLVKPFSMREILAKVNQLLDRSTISAGSNG